MDRRAFLWAGGCAAASSALAAPKKTAPAHFGPGFRQVIVRIEQASGGRLGVAVIDTGSGERLGYRAAERFPMCSTFKFALAAVVLKQVEAGRERLDRRVPIAAGDILSNSPFSEKHVGGTATVAELCGAAITVSDNSAANLLLRTIGGPAGFTRRLRAFGDPVSRLDRWETAMGEAAPADVRDTTSPEAMAGLAQRLVLGNVLAPTSRARLTEWMKRAVNGKEGLPAGLPGGWGIGHKTGSGGHGTDNQVGILWPPRRAPLIVASYLTQSTLPEGKTRPVHAQVARAVVAALA
jgi:beta-lactamase class A